MVQYYPDFTGTDTNYLRQNDPFVLSTTGTQIDLPTFFANSLELVTSDGTATKLVKGVDYDVLEADYDFSTLAKAQAARSDFTGPLAKSFTILRSQASLPVAVTANYQMFYLTSGAQPVAAGVGSVQLTPEWVADITRRITAQEQLTARVTNPGSTTVATPKFLEFDINGTTAANVVTETYTVDTFNGISVIRPIQGSFFKDSVTIVDSNGDTLVEGTDYIVFDCNFIKTANTTNVSGIYDLILITKSYGGTLNVTYRAVGGEVTIYDISSIYTSLQGLITFLGSSTYLTTESLADEPIIQQLLNQITVLGDKMRSLLTTPNYGSATTGTTVVKQIAATDTNIHWYTLGTLYKVSSATTAAITTSDRMKLHVQLTGNKFMCDVDVAVDLTNTRHPVTIQAKDVVYDNGFTLFGDSAASLTFYPPRFRVVWDNGVAGSGATLQIGVTLPALNDTLVVEDMSGVESCWLLDTTGGAGKVVSPNDTAFLLPDGQTEWSQDGGTSQVSSKMVIGEDGVLMYAGNLDLSTITNASAGFTLNNIFGNYLDMPSVKSVEAIFMETTGTIHRARLSIGNDLMANANSWRIEGLIPVSGAGDSSQFEISVDMSTDPLEAMTAYLYNAVATGYSLRYLIAKG